MQITDAANMRFQNVNDPTLKTALDALGRSINLHATYGEKHPVFVQSVNTCTEAVQALFQDRRKLVIGAFNGVMTIDGTPVSTVGTLQKSLERQLVRLRITGLRINRGISREELVNLAGLLSCREAEAFNADGLPHIETEETRYEAVQEGQTVANTSDLTSGMNHGGVLNLDDEIAGSGSELPGGGESTVKVDQIIAFLQGEFDGDEQGLTDEVAEIASDPARLGQLIMESVAIRQSASELKGESLSDVILGCLRRTFSGLRQRPEFQTSEGVADLQKSLLLLEESMLERIRSIAGESDAELDRQIVQAVREMDESLGFELAASRYMEYREAIEQNKEVLKEYVRNKGSDVARELLPDTGFPSNDWKQIVVESHNPSAGAATPPVAAGLSTLTVIIEKLESLIKSNQINEGEVAHLIGQASSNLDSTTHSTKEKLDSLSYQLQIVDEDTGTIDGHANRMDRKELLSSLAEIAQELMQPITAINTSIEMLLCGYVGNVSSEQRTLLSLASNSGDDLRYLMRELINIVGLPINRGVDKRYHLAADNNSPSGIGDQVMS